MSLRAWWKRCQLRCAQEEYARWKAEAQELRRLIREEPYAFGTNPYNLNRAIRAAGKEAMYLERVETLMRDS